MHENLLYTLFFSCFLVISSFSVEPNSIANRYVAEISDNAFNGDTNLTSVNFEDAVRLKKIGRYSFADCTSLTGEVVIPESVTTMQISAFQGCSSLESVVINAGISTVYNQTFYKCTSLSSVTLGSTEKLEITRKQEKNKVYKRFLCIYNTPKYGISVKNHTFWGR